MLTIKLRTLIVAGLVLVVLGGLGAALLVHLGVYNIAATSQHTRAVFRLMDYAMYRSVKARSDSAAVPELTDERRIRSGASHYRAHCLQCHGAPGVAPDELAFGMTPAPVNLVSTARTWQPQEMFWVVKHGIKMTGMPAWEYRLTDDEIWNIVAFVERMVVLGPREYAALAQAAPEHRPARTAGVAQAGDPPARSSVPDSAKLAPRGNAEAGRRATEQYLCTTCHTIPGIVGANRHVGPPLNGVARRTYIAGILPNTPENMVLWLRNPQQFDPSSAMPSLGLTVKDAQDIAAYLYTLDDVR